jgi:hypothetical protein
MINADLAMLLAFLKTKTSLIIKNTSDTISPTIDTTIKTMCGMKLESVMEVVNGRSASFDTNYRVNFGIRGAAASKTPYNAEGNCNNDDKSADTDTSNFSRGGLAACD